MGSFVLQPVQLQTVGAQHFQRRGQPADLVRAIRAFGSIGIVAPGQAIGMPAQAIKGRKDLAVEIDGGDQAGDTDQDSAQENRRGESLFQRLGLRYGGYSPLALSLRQQVAYGTGMVKPEQGCSAKADKKQRQQRADTDLYRGQAHGRFLML